MKTIGRVTMDFWLRHNTSRPLGQPCRVINCGKSRELRLAVPVTVVEVPWSKSQVPYDTAEIEKQGH